MNAEPVVTLNRDTKKDDLIVITGAGGFIAGALTRYFHNQGFTRIRAIDKKPLPNWYQHVPGVENLCLDVSEKENAIRAVEGAVEVYNLAADMGGMGFIERFRIECLRSILINTHMVEAAYRAGAKRYFFSSSACAYNVTLQQD
ncbi:MAG TPA: NAD-dependent epimerase/dehydratase family protein, partial [Methylococcales bacterium]